MTPYNLQKSSFPFYNKVRTEAECPRSVPCFFGICLKIRPDFFSGKIPQTLGRAEKRGTIVKNDEF